VSWPTRDELRASTIVVIVTVLIVAAYIGVVDRVSTWPWGWSFKAVEPSIVPGARVTKDVMTKRWYVVQRIRATRTR
jgi:preprotein translocase SecE subunit